MLSNTEEFWSESSHLDMGFYFITFIIAFDNEFQTRHYCLQNFITELKVKETKHYREHCDKIKPLTRQWYF